MRRVCVFTATRAEYGILRELIRAIDSATDLELQLLVSGTHLSPEFGMTVEELESDRFVPSERVEMLLSSDTPAGVCKSMGLAIAGYGEAFARLQPDILVVLGDRYEAFCAAAAAHVCRLPIAHIHGGESTEGATDEAFRHSITKMAHLHFPCCEEYRSRIIQLGESPESVLNVGALTVESIRKTRLLHREELQEDLRFQLGDPLFLVTYHPVTLEQDTADKQFSELLQALDSYSSGSFILTKANADASGRIVNAMIDEYAELHPDHVLAVSSLGSRRYLSAMALSAAVIGNSSSGIVEAPIMRVPTVNIGDRQKGRVRAPSIIDCSPTQASIVHAIAKAISPRFRRSFVDMPNPFEQEGTVSRIVAALAEMDLRGRLKKTFWDLTT